LYAVNLTVAPPVLGTPWITGRPDATFDGQLIAPVWQGRMDALGTFEGQMIAPPTWAGQDEDYPTFVGRLDVSKFTGSP
jgi:hypothetical protein